MENYLIQIIVYSISVLLGLCGFYYIFKNDFIKYTEAAVPIQKLCPDHSLILVKAQAYERMLLLLDRINPSQLVFRNAIEGLSALAYQHNLIKDLQAEYQHNVAQFLYLSPGAVQMMRKVQADTIQLIQSKTLQLGEMASAKDLATELLLYMANLKESPYEFAADYLQHDFQK